jgi:hypothetical protein
MNSRTRSRPDFGTRFIAELGLDLVPDLRKLFVTAQLAARDRGHHFLVRHGEAHVAAEAVLEAEQVVAHHVPAAGFLPQFGRIQGGEREFLRAHRVHFLPHDVLNLQQRALRQEQEAVDAGGELADVSGA